MYVKDMPSVALGCVDRQVNRMDLELVLDGVVDDRIAAAYAIVELGKSESPRKGADSPSCEVDEDIDVDEADQYHQVPRSPECLRQDRRGHSAGASPARSLAKAAENLPPKFVHVKGAVMPSRTIGDAVQKLASKRRHEDDMNGSAIKAKLARMLIGKKSSVEEIPKAVIEEGQVSRENFKVEDESSKEEDCGRFVRTSMPILEPASKVTCVQSCVQTPVKSEPRYSPDVLQMKSERSFSDEEINMIRDSLWKKRCADLDMKSNFSHVSLRQLVAIDDSAHCDVASTTFSRSLNPQLRSKFSEVARNELSSWTGRGASVENSAAFPLEDQTLELATSWPVRDNRMHLVGTSGQSVTNAHTGLFPYFVVPPMRLFPSQIKSEFKQPDAGLESDALRKLEQFSLSKRYHESTMSRDDFVVPEARNTMADVPFLAGRFFPIFGSSLSGITSMSGSPVSNASYQSSTLLESKSLQDLKHVPTSVSPKSSYPMDGKNLNFGKQISQNNERHKTLKKSENVQTCSTSWERNRKLSVIRDALEMVRSGDFGSLKTIQALYNSRKLSDISKFSKHRPVQGAEHNEGIGSSVQHSEDLTVLNQESPLDLSRCHSRILSREDVREKCSSTASRPSKTFDCFGSTCDEKGHYDLISESTLDVTQTQVFSLPYHDDSNGKSDSDAVINKSSDVNEVETNGRDEGSSSSPLRSIPNNQLPPKKRKLRQLSQSCDLTSTTKSPAQDSCGVQKYDISPLNNIGLDKHRAAGKDFCNVQKTGSKVKSTLGETEVKPLQTDILDGYSLYNAAAVRDEDGDLPLHIAVAQGSLEVVKKLLPIMSQVGVSVDSCNNNRQTALHLAVISNQPQMVDVLLGAAASASVYDRKGNTSLHLAVRYKSLACLNLILKNSRVTLDLDARNYEGLTALHIGVQLSQTEAVTSLLSHGANVNIMDGTNGRTPLFYAVEGNNYSMASTLLRHGSDPCIASYSGCTPLQIATAKSLRDMTSILEGGSA